MDNSALALRLLSILLLVASALVLLAYFLDRPFTLWVTIGIVISTAFSGLVGLVLSQVASRMAADDAEPIQDQEPV